MKREELKESYEIELKDILNQMDVPEARKDLTYHNLQWLKRNIGIKNNQNKRFYRAMAIIHLLSINEK